MDNRTTAAAVKKPSVVRVTPIPRRNQPTPTISTKTGSPIHVPPSRGGWAEGTLVRRPYVSKQKIDQAERARHVEELRGRIRGLLHQAADLRAHRPNSRSPPQDSRYQDEFEEVGGSRLADLLSILLGESQSETNLRGPIQRILKEIDNILREDVEQQLRNAQEQSDRRLENLTLRFDQTLRQKESTHLREITELHGRIDYLQDQLRATRELNDSLEQRLENTNLELLERSQNIGCTMAEIEDLRREVEELRLFKRRHRQEMESIDRLRQELEKHKLIAKTVVEEFVKVENERDELRMEFDKNLKKLRQSNQRRHHAIIAELDEAEDEILS